MIFRDEKTGATVLVIVMIQASFKSSIILIINFLLRIAKNCHLFFSLLSL